MRRGRKIDRRNRWQVTGLWQVDEAFANRIMNEGKREVGLDLIRIV